MAGVEGALLDGLGTLSPVTAASSSYRLENTCLCVCKDESECSREHAFVVNISSRPPPLQGSDIWWHVTSDRGLGAEDLT